MNLLFKYAGIILTIIGVAFLVIPFFTNTMTNVMLGTGLAIEVVGIILTFILGQMTKSVLYTEHE